MKKMLIVLFRVFVILLSSCHHSNNSSKTTNNVNNVNNLNCQSPGGDTSDFATPLGRLYLEWRPSFTIFQGRVWRSAVPDPFTETPREGFCRLLESTPSFCDPPCEWETQVCMEGVCVNYPQRLHINTLTLTGVAQSPVTVRADNTGEYTWYQDVPPAASQVTLTAFGGELEPFVLETCVPFAFDVTGDWSNAFNSDNQVKTLNSRGPIHSPKLACTCA